MQCVDRTVIFRISLSSLFYSNLFCYMSQKEVTRRDEESHMLTTILAIFRDHPPKWGWPGPPFRVEHFDFSPPPNGILLQKSRFFKGRCWDSSAFRYMAFLDPYTKQLQGVNFQVDVNCVDRIAWPNRKWSTSTKIRAQRGILLCGMTCHDNECCVFMWGFSWSMQTNRKF